MQIAQLTVLQITSISFAAWDPLSNDMLSHNPHCDYDGLLSLSLCIMSFLLATIILDPFPPCLSHDSASFGRALVLLSSLHELFLSFLVINIVSLLVCSFPICVGVAAVVVPLVIVLVVGFTTC